MRIFLLQLTCNARIWVLTSQDVYDTKVIVSLHHTNKVCDFWRHVLQRAGRESRKEVASWENPISMYLLKPFSTVWTNLDYSVCFHFLQWLLPHFERNVQSGNLLLNICGLSSYLSSEELMYQFGQIRTLMDIPSDLQKSFQGGRNVWSKEKGIIFTENWDRLSSMKDDSEEGT